MQGRCKALETALLEQQAKEAALQLQVAALCAELTRAADVAGNEPMQSSMPEGTASSGRLQYHAGL